MRKIIYVLWILIIILGISGCGKKEVYTVTFDSLGGTSIEKQSVAKGKCVTKPSDPKKEGFTFVEWQYENKTYKFDTPVESDILLTAFYTVNEGTEIISVAFNADNGEEIKTVNIAKGATVSEPPLPQKQGYKFKGWFLENDKFDFSTILNQNTVLVAKWEVDKNAANDKESSTSNKSSGSKKPSETSNGTESPTTTTKNHTIKFKEVEGIWYVEGHDDATLEFSIYDNTWVNLESKGFDYHTCVFEANTGRGGIEYFYDNGKFYSEEITLEGTNKLIYTKNNKTIVFYRQKNYPTEKLWEHEQLLKDINGYYWYLDGYDYTYLYPTIIPWYDHECLQWESQNINITESKLVAYEDFEPNAYKQENSSASSNTHNTLMVNPIEFADSLISNFKMRVKNNKLYLTIRGKEYSFTKHTAKKEIIVSIDVEKSDITATVGDTIKIEAVLSPWWHSLSVSSSSSGFVTGSTNNLYPANGQANFTFRAQSVGTGKITIRENNSGKTKTINVTILPIKVSGVSIDKKELELYKGESGTLTANVTPSNATNKGITWSSSNPNVATVSSSGKVTAKSFGTAQITATTNDGDFSASCNVTVKQKALTAKGSIGMEIRTSSSSIVRGVGVSVTASGGSENYVEYYIKLFYNDQLIGEVADKNLFVTPLRNGTYRAEIYVKDSSGNEITTTTTTTISY